MIGISKEQQLKHNKNPKVKTFGTKKSFIKKKSDKNILTQDEKDYLNYLQSIKYNVVCFVCGKNNPNDPIEWHHIKKHSSDKKNNFGLIPLCGCEHHRLGELSPHGGARKFRDMFDFVFQEKYAKRFYVEYLELKSV